MASEIGGSSGLAGGGASVEMSTVTVSVRSGGRGSGSDGGASTTNDNKPALASIRSLLQFATARDYFCIIAGALLHVIMGAVLSLQVIFFAGGLDSLNKAAGCGESIAASLQTVLWQLMVMGAISFAAKGGGAGLLLYAQKRQTARYRVEYLRAVIRQDVGWFDVSNPQQLSTSFGEAVTLIDKALGKAVWGVIPETLGTTIVGFIVAFTYGDPLVACVCLSALPVAIGGVLGIVYVAKQSSKQVSTAYATSGGVASESLCVPHPSAAYCSPAL